MLFPPWMKRAMNRNTEQKASPFIPFARPTIGDEEKEAVRQVLESGWLTSGRYVEEFEEAFRRYLDVPFAKALNSATAGLHLSLEALGIPEGSFVLTTPFTFTSTSEVVRYMGAHPLFVDIDEETLAMDVQATADTLEKYGSKVSALLPVHVAGRICPVETFAELAGHYNIPLIEDTAHAFPVRRNGRAAGTLGTAGVFSFYATKTITTGEGGMVVTRDPDIAERISVMRLHGIDRKAWDRYISRRPGSWEYDIIAAGYKYNLTDLAAALGIEQLKKAASFLERRRYIATRYLEGLAGLDYLTLPEPSDEHSWHLFILRLVPEALRIDREQFAQELLQRGVATSVHYKPLHLMTYYRELYGFKPEDFPVSLRVFRTCLSLPIYPGLKEEEIDRVIDAVRKTGATGKR